MRPGIVLALALLLALPLVAAHGENVIYHLEVDSTGPAAGAILFTLDAEHTFLGIGVGGCAIGTVGALRIVTPTGSLLEATYGGIQGCSGSARDLQGDGSILAPGEYRGTYELFASAPLLVVVYGSDG